MAIGGPKRVEHLDLAEEYLLLILRRAVKRGDMEAADDVYCALAELGRERHGTMDYLVNLAWDFNVDCQHRDRPRWVEDTSEWNHASGATTAIPRFKTRSIKRRLR